VIASNQGIALDIQSSSPEVKIDNEGQATQLGLSEDSFSLTARIDAAISKCAEVGPSFFGSLNQSGQALAPAYAVMLLMKQGGDAIIDAAIQHPEFPVRQRAPGKDNLALIAVLLAAKPKNKQQRTWCYEWAIALIEAAHIGIAADDFPGWITGVTLKECKAKVRKRRCKDKGKILKQAQGKLLPEMPREMGLDPLAGPQPISIAAQEPRLEIHLLNENGTAQTLPLVISQQVYTALAQALQDLSPDCRAADALWAFLDAVDDADLTPVP